MNCHICDEFTESFLYEKTNITYYHCKSCEYIFKSPECYQDLETQKKRYNLHENNEEDEGYRAYFRRFLDFVLPYIDNIEIALDFGCGSTLLLAQLIKDEGVECDYYDPIFHPNISYNSKKYQLIVSTEVFEHLYDPKNIFESLVNRLERGGYLAIQTQFHTNNREDFKKWYYHHDSTHIVFFRPRTFQILCRKFGCNYLKDNGKNMVIMQKI